MSLWFWILITNMYGIVVVGCWISSLNMLYNKTYLFIYTTPVLSHSLKTTRLHWNQWLLTLLPFLIYRGFTVYMLCSVNVRKMLTSFNIHVNVCIIIEDNGQQCYHLRFRCMHSCKKWTIKLTKETEPFSILSIHCTIYSVMYELYYIVLTNGSVMF